MIFLPFDDKFLFGILQHKPIDISGVGQRGLEIIRNLAASRTDLSIKDKHLVLSGMFNYDKVEA